ncbi:hypothetical protein [Streptomyces axinellae]|uniref:Uncharacterized protein n=1 Tax=Streptomyces axinellae TaxID=552788 RepID=A0ABN3PR23_9ACTN
MAVSVTRVMNDSFTVAADGSYAARLGSRGPGLWFVERWTLGGPEPYAVPLPVEQPEEPDSQVLPLADGRVLIARRVGGAHCVSLLYPSGPDTGELRLGSVHTSRLTLLPPAPCGVRAYALALAEDERSTTVWRVAGGISGRPERVARVEGRCSGGAWLDPEGRLLAVDREMPGDRPGSTGGAGAAGGAGSGRATVKTVAVDLGRGGEVSPLLQIAEESNDRLLLADPDSGLLLVRSDAPGEDRLGWGVVGSHRPVRFPEVLHPAGTRLTPIAVQPRQTLLPERCAVALRVDAGGGTWLAVWRPGLKELRHIASPPGWLTGKGLWTAAGDLCVPYATAHDPCGVATMHTPLANAPDPDGERRSGPAGDEGDAGPSDGDPPGPGPGPGSGPGRGPGPGPGRGPGPGPGHGPVGGAGAVGGPGPTPAPRLPVQPGSGQPQRSAGRPAAPPMSPPSGPVPSPRPAPSGPGGPAGPGMPGTPAVPPPAPSQRPPRPPQPPSGDVTGLQHHGHGAQPSGRWDSAPRRGVSAGGAAPFGALAGPVSKPVPLQQSPLTSGMA